MRRLSKSAEQAIDLITRLICNIEVLLRVEFVLLCRFLLALMLPVLLLLFKDAFSETFSGLEGRCESHIDITQFFRRHLPSE